tara:strand:- start:705 stop:977 length:273 start_codon:yes stop_codon:yes gene_type:complete
MEELLLILSEFGFTVTLALGMAYFIYYTWQWVSNELEPALEKQHIALIRVIDQTRMLDQDMIRLQQKINVVNQYKEKHFIDEVFDGKGKD